MDWGTAFAQSGGVKLSFDSLESTPFGASSFNFMKREIEFASHPGNLSLVRDFVRQFLKGLSFTEAEKDLMVLGLDEACTNVIRYAYNHEPDQPICLICEERANGVSFRLRDFGSQCDPAQFNGRPLDLVQPGGLGIHLIRKAFNQVDYNLKKQGTELVLAKFLNESEARPHRSQGAA